MFPTIEKSVIVLILEANQYSNEPAIEALLQLSASPSLASPSSSAATSSEPKVDAALPKAPNPVDLRKSREDQIHDDERLAHALQLKLSGNVPMSDAAVSKAVQQLEADEALALSLQSEYFDQVEGQRQQSGSEDRIRDVVNNNRSDVGDGYNSDDEGVDVLDEMSKDINEVVDKASVKMNEFGKDVSNAWSTFTTVVKSKLDETFNTDNGHASPQLVVRTAPRAAVLDDEEKQPFL